MTVQAHIRLSGPTVIGRPVGLKISQKSFQKISQSIDCYVKERFSTRFLKDFERSDHQEATTEQSLF